MSKITTDSSRRGRWKTKQPSGTSGRRTVRLRVDAQTPIVQLDKHSMEDRILHAALEWLGTFGFEGTSTRGVAARAGVNHSLLAYYFDSKDKLWRSTMDHALGHYLDSLELRRDRLSVTNTAAHIHAFVENFVRFMSRVPQLYRIMSRESTQGSECIDWLLDTYLKLSFSEICALIELAQAAGTVRAGEPARIYYSIISLGGTLLTVSTEHERLTGLNVFSERELKITIASIIDYLNP